MIDWSFEEQRVVEDQGRALCLKPSPIPEPMREKGRMMALRRGRVEAENGETDRNCMLCPSSFMLVKRGTDRPPGIREIAKLTWLRCRDDHVVVSLSLKRVTAPCNRQDLGRLLRRGKVFFFLIEDIIRPRPRVLREKYLTVSYGVRFVVTFRIVKTG